MNNLCIMNSLRHIPANSVDGCNPFEVRVPSVGTNHNILTEVVLLKLSISNSSKSTYSHSVTNERPWLYETLEPE